MKNIIYILAIVSLAVGINACDNPGDGGDTPPEELINIVRITLHDSLNMQDSSVLQFIDADGPAGPDKPVITGDTLRIGRVYLGKVELYRVHRRASDSLESITHEIRDAATAHQFFYLPVEGHWMTPEVIDRDVNGQRIGLEIKLRIGAQAPVVQSSLLVLLKHYENPSEKGDIARGETDVEVNFPIYLR